MLLRDKIAGFLMAFGAIGLAIAPLLGEQKSQRTSSAEVTVAVAITMGPQLNLLRKGEKLRLKQHSTTPQRDVVCNNIVHLVIADVGLQCRELRSAQNLALAGQ
ncbi:MAG: hypothetical protein JXQ99_07020 [Hyphomicrobiaceae bacterium]